MSLKPDKDFEVYRLSTLDDPNRDEHFTHVVRVDGAISAFLCYSMENQQWQLTLPTRSITAERFEELLAEVRFPSS